MEGAITGLGIALLLDQVTILLIAITIDMPVTMDIIVVVPLVVALLHVLQGDIHQMMVVPTVLVIQLLPVTMHVVPMVVVKVRRVFSHHLFLDSYCQYNDGDD